MIYCLHTSRRIEASNRLNRRFSIKGSWLYSGCSTVDMSSAFDCVDHIILVRRLNVFFGIDENALEWIVSYLTGRRQYVRYNGQTSEISVVECGVPRGSVLGPMYFVLFTADVFAVSLTSTASPFMDMPMTCRSTTAVSSTTCTTSHPGLSTASVVSGSGWQTTDSSSTRRKPSGLVRLVVWPCVRSSRSWSTGPPFFHPRQSAT